MAVWQERAELIFKEEGLEKLKNAHILVVGLGGVGSFAAEFIARAGVGKMTIVDGDTVDITNVNQNENLKVYESGYQLYETKISNFLKSNKHISLKERIIDIEPVVINPKKYKLKNYGTSNSKSAYASYDSENKGKFFREYAIKVENTKRLKIKNITLLIKVDIQKFYLPRTKQMSMFI